MSRAHAAGRCAAEGAARASRRHHLARLKRKVRDYYGGWPRMSEREARTVGVLAHTRTLCSCWMCGNPRRYTKEVPLAEMRLHGRRRRPSRSPGASYFP